MIERFLSKEWKKMDSLFLGDVEGWENDIRIASTVDKSGWGNRGLFTYYQLR